jgi:hypothetical protein
MIHLVTLCTLPLANPTQEEVFQSINSQMTTPVDLSKAVPYLLVAVASAIMIGLYNYHRKRRANPGRLNNPAKLSREICRHVNLRTAELKQLKILADEQEVEYPFTLILCPSLLGKAIRSPSPRVDRAVVRAIVEKLKQSLAERPQ